MHTIPVPTDPWGQPKTPQGRYEPTRSNGKRVPGWERVNITLLASDLKISFRYLLAVLTGQRNCTLSLLQQVAQALGIPLTDLISRMEYAYYRRIEQQASKLDPAERRRLRSEQRAMANR